MTKHLIQKKLRRLLNPGFLVTLAIVVLGIWAVVRFEGNYRDRFYPNVFVGGVAVGGKTYSAARDSFQEKAVGLEKEGLIVHFENSAHKERIVAIPMSRNGLTSDNSIEYLTFNDWESDVRTAYAWGRTPNLLRTVYEQVSLIFGKKNFNFSNTIKEPAIASLFIDELRGFFIESLPASFIVSDGTISISKERIGERINEAEVMQILAKKMSTFDTSPVTITSSTDTPEILEKDLAPFSDQVKKIAQGTTLLLHHDTHTWKIRGRTLATWLIPKPDGSLGIDPGKLEKYLSGTAAKYIDNPPVNSRFEVREGTLTEVVPGKAGNKIDQEQLAQKINEILSEIDTVVTAKTYTVEIDTRLVEPEVTKATVEKYEIENLVGQVSTTFAGSSRDREHNIKIGVATISGMLIAPGAEFSTIAAIGPVTEKEGYVKEMVIKENTTTKEFGGGLCQVATTLFRLALNAGLPITERMNHKFVVHYYDPPGLDATIYGPHPDFRFVNDTNHYLLLQGRVENGRVIMELYGKKDGRTVTISKPTMSDKIPAPPTNYVRTPTLFVGQTKCTEAPHDGLTTDVLYTVDYPDGTTKEKKFHSVYQPWQKVCLVGTTVPDPL